MGHGFVSLRFARYRGIAWFAHFVRACGTKIKVILPIEKRGIGNLPGVSLSLYHLPW
jgi:hypothetical protein